MATLTCSDTFLAIASCLGVKVVDLSCRSQRVLSIPDTSLSTKETAPEDAPNSSKASGDCTGQILCMKFSDDGHFLAACNDKKDLAIWNVNADWQTTNCRRVMRRPVSLAFTKDRKVLLVADKAGDVYSLNVDDDVSPTTPILGHVSMLLDLVLSKDNKYVMTAERDEKIRVSRYPNTYNIQTFCLGHTEFVSSLSVLPANWHILVSASGDCSLRFWDFVKGKELARIPCTKFTSKQCESEDNDKIDSTKSVSRASNPKVAVKGCRCSPKGNTLAVLYFGLPEISLFQVTKYDHDVEWTHLRNISLTKEPWDMCFDANGQLWILQPVEGDSVQVWRQEEKSGQIQYSRLDDIVENSMSSVIAAINEDWDFFKGSLEVKEEMSTLFKQWYDNVKGYLERKEERMSSHAPKRRKK